MEDQNKNQNFLNQDDFNSDSDLDLENSDEENYIDIKNKEGQLFDYNNNDNKNDDIEETEDYNKNSDSDYNEEKVEEDEEDKENEDIEEENNNDYFYENKNEVEEENEGDVENDNYNKDNDFNYSEDEAGDETEEENNNYFDENKNDEDDLFIKDNSKKEEDVFLGKEKVILIKKLIENIKENNDRLIQILSSVVSDEDEMRIKIGQLSDENINQDNEDSEGKIIEGVFDGEKMIGPDGKQYNVPANYASKSKLVEGDIMKLTITGRGTFVYKQIGPIERRRVVGILIKDEDGECCVESEDGKWRVLPASVTYFKGSSGDETIILVPKSGRSNWGSVENIMKRKEEY